MVKRFGITKEMRKELWKLPFVIRNKIMQSRAEGITREKIKVGKLKNAKRKVL